MNFRAHITRDPNICGGEAVITGTRVTLRTILASLAEGDSPGELLAAFPTLTEVDIRAVIAYAASSTVLEDELRDWQSMTAETWALFPYQEEDATLQRLQDGLFLLTDLGQGGVQPLLPPNGTVLDGL